MVHRGTEGKTTLESIAEPLARDNCNGMTVNACACDWRVRESRVDLFSLESVSLSFGEKEILNNLSLSVLRGQKVILRGQSGSGKSTLLRLLLGFAQPDAGVVRFEGRELTPSVAGEVRRSAAFVTQSVELGTGTVGKILEEWYSIGAFGDRPADGELKDALEKIGLSLGILEQDMQELSGGERQRVGLLMALLRKRSVFLLDEPTAALDTGLKKQVADLFLNDPGITLIASAHDPVWFEDRDVTLLDLS